MRSIGEGSEFADHRLERVLGYGGMGIVYEAVHLQLERTVALKVMSPGLANDPSFRERFKRESRAAASLHHPNIVTIHDAGEEDGLLYIAMEFVPGKDLKEHLRTEGAIEGQAGARMLAQIADALDAAHNLELVHRDVKPGNILLRKKDDRDVPYLTDFGLTRHVSSAQGLTKTGQWIGTLDYVAPEQVKGEQVDKRADVYALACVYFEVLTGRVPFEAENDIARMWAQVNEPPPRADVVNPELNEQVAEVLIRGMAKDRDERQGSAGELAHEVLRALDGEPGTAPTLELATTRISSVPPADAERPSTKNSGWGARGAALAVLAAAAGLASGWFLESRLVSTEPEVDTVASENVTVRFTDPWQLTQSGEAIKGFSLEGKQIKLADQSGSSLIRAGRMSQAVPALDPLPESLADRWRPAPKRDAIKVGTNTWFRYSGKIDNGGAGRHLVVTMIPTRDGYQGLACQTPVAATDAQRADCDDVIDSLGLEATEAWALGPDRKLGRSLGEVQSKLKDAEKDNLPALEAGYSPRQRKSAVAVSRAYSSQASNLRASVNDSGTDISGRAPAEALVKAINLLSEGYEKLGSAARKKDEGKYRAASELIETGAEAYGSQWERLRALGYGRNDGS